MTSHRIATMALLGLAALAAQAQDATRIVAATVYPDSARVERELKVPGGTRHIALACVPAGVDVSTLQVDGDPELRADIADHLLTGPAGARIVGARQLLHLPADGHRARQRLGLRRPGRLH